MHIPLRKRLLVYAHIHTHINLKTYEIAAVVKINCIITDYTDYNKAILFGIYIL